MTMLSKVIRKRVSRDASTAAEGQWDATSSPSRVIAAGRTAGRRDSEGFTKITIITLITMVSLRGMSRGRVVSSCILSHFGLF